MSENEVAQLEKDINELELEAKQLTRLATILLIPIFIGICLAAPITALTKNYFLLVVGLVLFFGGALVGFILKLKPRLEANQYYLKQKREQYKNLNKRI